MKKLRWQFVILLFTGLLVGILLISQQQPAVSQNTVPTPAKGGSYSEALVGNLKRLNPILDQYNPVDEDVDHLIYSSLLQFDSRGLPVGDLAKSWGISKDGTLYNFSLRTGMKWQDGQPITSDDVLFTVGLLKDSSSIVPSDIQTFWKDIEVNRLSDTLIQFRLPEPFAPFLDYLTFGILPKHLLNNVSADQLAASSFNENPVGSGPYRFDHLVIENDQITGVVLSVNDKFYGQKPFIEQIIFRYYPDAETAFNAYVEGEVQGIGEVTPEILPQVLADPGLSTYTSRLPEMTMLYLNLNNSDVPFFSDANLRQALMLSINRQWIIDNIYKGQAIMANGPIMPGNWAFYDGIQQVGFDPEAARKMLTDAGYKFNADTQNLETKDGTVVKFQLVYPDDDVHQAIAENIQKSWAGIGIAVDLQSMPYDALVSDQLDPRTYQAALVDINLSSSPDPDPYPFWDQAQATGGQNYSQWDDKTASEYLEQARITTDVAERTRLYKNFQVIFEKEMPSLPLFYPVYTYAIDSQILGVQVGSILNPGDRFTTISNWFISDQNLRAKTVVPTVTSTP